MSSRLGERSPGSPDPLTAVEAAPLMCAGITTFNSLRHAGALPGDLVAVLGLGGLGHLGVQFASKMGFDTVAIARGRDKEPLAHQLGARLYINSLEQERGHRRPRRRRRAPRRRCTP